MEDDKAKDTKSKILYSEGEGKNDAGGEPIDGHGVRVRAEENLITFTDAARDAFLLVLDKENKPKDTVLRLGVVGGGCAGFNYDMFYSEGTTDRDRVIVSNDVSLVVDEASLMYLVGTTVDYITNLKGSGFTFNNPNAKSTCGCAMSFTV
jgi:iron-sulfur cluster assembly accessory protein